MIGILGAMQEEVDALISSLENKKTVPGTAADFYTGQLCRTDVVVAKTGIGKVLSALSAAEMITRFAPERLIFTGIAGGLDQNLAIGDLVVGSDSLQYDFDVRALGFPVGSIPFSRYREIAADPRLLEAMRDFSPKEYQVHFGRILTGDTFVTDKHSPGKADLFAELKGLAVEMEGASVALTAEVYNVPALILRFISDGADGQAPGNFTAFLAQASERSLQVVRFLLEKLS